jgi:hypothetical protein
MKILKPQLVFFLLVSPVVLMAQAESVFNDIRMEESLDIVLKKVKEISEDCKMVSIDEPGFPLAMDKEEHLVCTNVKTDNGIVGKVVFTFADDKLEYIMSKGNVNRVFAEKRSDTSRAYMEYDVYFSDRLFLNKRKDLAWILTEESLHTNLFAWINPYLDPDYKPQEKSSEADNVPAFLKMGALLDDLKPVLEKNSDFIQTEKLDGSDPNAQIQINCFGVEYLGFPRKVEARFGDNKLNVVWILTGKGEEDRIREALINQYGQPIFVNEDWEIFHDWQVGLRKDKPEVLLMEKNIGLGYKKSYFKQ